MRQREQWHLRGERLQTAQSPQNHSGECLSVWSDLDSGLLCLLTVCVGVDYSQDEKGKKVWAVGKAPDGHTAERIEDIFKRCLQVSLSLSVSRDSDFGLVDWWI